MERSFLPPQPFREKKLDWEPVPKEPKTLYGIFRTKNGRSTRQLASDFLYSDKSEADARCASLKESNGETLLGNTIFGYSVEKLTAL